MPPLPRPQSSSERSRSDGRARSFARRLSRRGFVGGTSAAAAAWSLPLPANGLFSDRGQRLRVGLVGCGGRGTGAALQAIDVDPSTVIVAMGDLFADQIGSAADLLGRAAGDRFVCPDDRRFSGPDAYRHVIDSGVDVVLLAAPPHTRPLHLEAAVAAGKHVYCEKPAAIDVEGVVRVAAATARGRADGLALVSGFCFRRDSVVAELVDRLHDGAIGRLRAARAHAAIGLPWRKPPETGCDPETWAIRNWISEARFSGGHFVERHVEAIDRVVWAFGDTPPLVAEPVLGPWRFAEDGDSATGAGIGNCPPGAAVRYTFPDGRTLEASIDRRERLGDRIVETVVGTQGRADLLHGEIAGRRGWVPGSGPRPNRHRVAMAALLSGVRSGRLPHDGLAMCRSTLVALMGRQAAETGGAVAWNDVAAAVWRPV